ncbi:RNA-binding S4 domain-containing protein [Ideonella livida]|uniref:RNA-binding S4 domain-containing protein n=1 Tax=Ideonella livida TaxID=2707176 RepID=A0A7C9TJ76_9BURK|nr:RNA-binding S4 domain-containing protein [Ideonella livida]NDY90844.1 RNA-binding S4 domain-containing protein [Ideonella livida]
MSADKSTQPLTFGIRGDHITLDALLKVLALAQSGGHAKQLIAQGLVQVDGQTETRKTCKLRPGQRVLLEGQEVRLVAQEDAGEQA